MAEQSKLPAASPLPQQRVTQLPEGIAGSQLRSADRAIGGDESPPLPINAELKSIGKREPRLDGRLKVTGAARYTADIRLPGMLYGVLITAEHPHARIRSIDISAAEKHPGVKAIHIINRLQGAAQMQGEQQNRYPLVRFAGQPIAGIAATTQSAAEETARLVRVSYEPLPFVVDVEKARRPDAPVVFEAAAEQAVTEEYDVFTHAGPAAAFRAPGHPQGAFALEQAIDALAHKLGMDPLALRDKIQTRGDRADAQRLQRKLGAEQIGWSKRHAPGTDQGPIKRVLGMAQAIWYRFTNRDSNCSRGGV